MVYRPLPRMTADDGTRRTSKLYKLFILTIVVGAFASVYYIYSYASANKNLKRKQRNLSYQLTKYASAYGKCERSLKTSKSDVLNYGESNKQLKASVKAKEKSLAKMDKINGETSVKLDQSYQFFLDVKGLVGDDQTVSEEKLILPETSSQLKAEIERLKSANAELSNLKLKHTETSKAHSILQVTFDELSTRASNLDKQLIALNANNQQLTAEIEKKKRRIEEDNSIQTSLEQTIERLQNELSRVVKELKNAKEAAALAAANPPPTQPPPPATTALGTEKVAVAKSDKSSKPVVKKSENAPEKLAVNSQTGVLTKTIDVGGAVKKTPVADTKAAATERRVVEEAHQLKIAPAPSTVAPTTKVAATKVVPVAPGTVGGDAEKQTEADMNKEIDALDDAGEGDEDEDFN